MQHLLSKIITDHFRIYRDTPTSKQCIQAFEEVVKRNNNKLSLRIDISELNEAHMLPDMSIIEGGSNECVAQVFNYFDLLGGKDSMNGAEVERFLQVRGILEPKGGDYK